MRNPGIDMKWEFIRFLEHECILEEFEKEFVRARPEEYFSRMCNYKTEALIVCAFTFENTDLGADFWHGKKRLWRYRAERIEEDKNG